MDFDDTHEEAAWREQVREYLTEHLADLRPRHAGGSEDIGDVKKALCAQQALLYAGGLVGITWPSEYGGQDGTPMQNVIAAQERVGSASPKWSTRSASACVALLREIRELSYEGSSNPLVRHHPGPCLQMTRPPGQR